MTDHYEVCIVGSGPAGLTAGIFTARAGLETLVLNSGEPILRRNAHLENVPGFPAGVNPRRFLEMLEDQARRNGCTLEEGTVEMITSGTTGDEMSGDGTDDPFTIQRANTDDITAEYVCCCSWADSEYLRGFEDVGFTSRGSKTYVDVDDDGSTGVDGLYAAGRIAGEPHQTVVSAGHGAKVALSIIHDSPVAFYHDWVAPEGYFTGRDREVPPGCEEIDAAERRRREDESMRVMREYFEQPHPDDPTQHPSVADDS